MSGIAGILHFDGKPVEPGLIQKMTSAMAHRGPDGISHWINGSVALGHCMLRTTPESLGEVQPLTNGDENLVLVFDGRLDNREDLQRKLSSRGIWQRDQSDAALARGAYRLWGEESPKYLLGDFVFAVWNVRDQTLFCARDHMGARPLYYARNEQVFAFASEDEALLGLPGVSNRPNEELIAHLLVPSFQNFEDDARSWLRDVSALLPARTLTVCSDGKARMRTYWRLEPGQESAYASDKECEEAFLAEFGEAVRCRMRTTGPVAAMMSGGMDSAGISAMVKRLLPEVPTKAFHTYSAIADDPAHCVESRCIKTLTRDLGSNAHFVSVPSMEGMVGLGDLIDTAWSNAHPVDNSILLPAMMCLAAGREGNRALLHGVSGDLTMHVPNRYPAYLMRNGQWSKSWQECCAASQNNTYLRGSHPAALFMRNVLTAYMPSRVKASLRGLGSAPFRNSVINPEFAAKLRLKDRLRAQAADQIRLPPDIRGAHAGALNSTSAGILLGLTGYEHMAGRYGVELRDPWADKRVVAFFLNLPITSKVRDGWTKYLARTAFAPDLDSGVSNRLGKEHLGWMMTWRVMEHSSEFVARTLEQGLYEWGDYVDSRALRVRYARYKVCREAVEWEFVYLMVVLILWLRRLTSWRSGANGTAGHTELPKVI